MLRTKEFWKMARLALKAIKDYQNFDRIVFEARMLRKNGQEFPVEISSKILFNEHGIPVGLQGSTRDITERKQAEEELLWRNEYLSALQETTVELLSQLELNILLENIVKRAGLLMGTASGYLDLVDPMSGQLKPRVGLGALAESLRHAVQPGEGVAGTVWQSGEPLVINDYDHWSGRIGDFTRETLSAVIGVPLLSDGQVQGVLGLAHEYATRRAFKSGDIEILTQFARLAMIAIENARLFSIARQELLERQKTEESLRESERRLATLMGNLPGMAYRCKNDSDWTMEFVSEGCMLLTGYEPDELVGNARIAYREVIHPDDRQEVWDEIQTAIRAQSKFQLTYRIHTLDGEERWVREQGQGVSVNGSELLVLEGLITDITEEKYAEKLVHARLELFQFSNFHSLEEVLQKTLDQVGDLTDSPIGFYHFVEEDQKTLSLQAWSTRTEKEFCQMEGKGLHYSLDQAGVWVDCVQAKKPVVHNDYPSLPHRKGLPEGHAPVYRELVVPILRADKIVAILGVGNKPSEYTKTDTDLVAYFADVAWEIAERKHAEHALLFNEEKLRNIVEHSTNMFYSHTPEHILTFISPQIKQILGYEPEEAMIRWTELVSENPSNQRGFDLTAEAIRTGKAQPPYELELIHKDGHFVWVEVREGPVVVEGKTTAIVGSLNDITERKQAELELYQSRQLLRSIMDSIPQRVFWKDLDLTYLGCNLPFARDAGLSTTDEVTGKTDFDLVWRASAELYRDDDLQVIQSNTSKLHFEEQMLREDGTHLWLRTSKMPLWDLDGKAIGVLGTYEDITDRKLAEIQYQTILRTALDGFWITDTQGKFLDVNDAYCELIGYTREELLTMCLSDIEAVENQADTQRHIQKVIETGKDHFATRHRRKDGALIDVEISANYLDMSGGRFFVFVHDITERKRSDRALLESEERYRRLAENAQDLIYRYELLPEPKFTYVSPAATPITGFTPEEHYADPQLGYKLVHPEDRHLLDAAARGGAPTPLVLRWVRKDGSIIWTEQRNVPVLENGKIIALEGIARDISERKQAELAIAQHAKELERSNAELEQFAYVASHDLQEPLRMISSYLQLLERRYKGQLDQDADEFIHYAVDGAARMQRLISDLLVYSRVGTRGKELLPNSSEGTLQSALQNLEVSIQETRADFTYDVMPIVRADEGQLLLLFQNLIGNAIKFHKEGKPKVHIGVKKVTDPGGEAMWQFSVEDNGIGIEPEYFEQVFVIFQRLHTREDFPGTGIGPWQSAKRSLSVMVGASGLIEAREKDPRFSLH